MCIVGVRNSQAPSGGDEGTRQMTGKTFLCKASFWETNVDRASITGPGGKTITVLEGWFDIRDDERWLK